MNTMLENEKTNYRQTILAVLLSLLFCLSGLSTVPVHAETIQKGESLYQVPRLTTRQQKQLNTAVIKVNHALYTHQSSVHFDFDGMNRMPGQTRKIIEEKIRQEAFRLNRDQLQNGQYLLGSVITTFETYGSNTTCDIEMDFRYNTTLQQEQQAWNTAQNLDRTLNISSNQTVGMQQIYDYVCRNYSYDKTTETRQKSFTSEDFNRIPVFPNVTAYGAFSSHQCTCTGFAQVFYLLCRAKGWTNVYVARNGRNSHAYNVVIPATGTPQFVDCCFGSSSSENQSKYFLVSQAGLNRRDSNHVNSVY